MKRLIIALILLMAIFDGTAQSDKKILNYIKKNVDFLADDKLEGRRTGTPGEALASKHIWIEMKENGLSPIFRSTKDEAILHYIQPFSVKEGMMVEKAELSLGDADGFVLDKEFSPMAYSKTGMLQIDGSGNRDASTQSKKLVYFDIQPMLKENASNVHFDAEEEIYKEIQKKSTSGVELIIIYNSGENGITYGFNPKSKREGLTSFVVSVSRDVCTQMKKKTSSSYSLKMNLSISEKFRNGYNAGGWINNGAEQTIILGAHYDHLGYGEDKNSLYAGSKPMIHNGADDNASGTAALLALSKILKKSGSKKFNYLFLAFSGEELGLYGSKYYTEHPAMDLNKTSYMINMDMVGRLNDSTHGLTVGGFGTSSAWGQIISLNDPYFKIKVDSAGNGPSDHTSFYRKDLPVLFFFTGTHSDYHKPSDDADKINYEGELKIVRYIESLIQKTAGMGKIPFSKTKESVASGKSSFKVSMGIMPDYTYSGNGVHVDGVSDNKPAQRAGIKTGDVIYKLGEYSVSDVQSYMQVLSKMEKGVPVKVKLKRGNEDLEMTVIF